MRRRFFVFLFTICMAAAFLPLSANAQQAETATVAFRVTNGIWEDESKLQEIQVPVGYVLSEEDIPVDMEPNAGYSGGRWDEDPVDYEVTGDVTFRFQFQKILSITFDANGGRWDDDSREWEVSALSGDPCEEMPEEPQRDGATFESWNIKANGMGEAFDEDTIITDNIRIYAIWTENIWITFDANGGFWNEEEYNDEGNSVTNRVEIQELEHVPEPLEDGFPEEPQREGWVFDSWIDQSGEIVDAQTEITEDTLLTAQWRRVLTVQFYANPEDSGFADFIESFKAAEVGAESLEVQLPVGEREGHTLVEWNTKADGSGQGYAPGSMCLLDADIELYGIWEKCSCTVIFEGMEDGVQCLWGDHLSEEELPQPRLDEDGCCMIGEYKYRFDGWRTGKDGGGEAFTVETVVSRNMHLYPSWIRRVNLTFKIENGTWKENGTIEFSIESDMGTAVSSVVPNAQPDEGYKIPGSWDRDPANLKADEDTVFTYTCKPLEVFQISFDTGGEARTVKEGEALGTLPIPVREGWSFVGWYTAETGGERVEKTTPATGSMTLYARWERIFQLRFDANAGEDPVTNLPEAMRNSDGTFRIPGDIPQRQGFTFLGWSREAADLSPEYNAGDTVTITEDTTFYGIWRKHTVFRLIYHANGGQGVPEPETAETDEVSHTFTVTMHFPTREGWQFLGWAESADGTQLVFGGEPCQVSGEKTLYAQWQQETRQVTVTFLNGNTEAARLTLISGSCPGGGMPQDPVRAGYRFLGWNTRQDGTGTALKPDTAVEADLTVYAQWEAVKKVTVTFLDRDEEVAQLILEPGAAIGGDLPGDPVRSGYLFRGWNTQLDGSGKTLSADSLVSQDLTAYAQWEKITRVTVIFQDRSEEADRITLDIGAQISHNMPEDPVRKGYRFLGWNTREDGTGKKLLPSTVIREDQTAYAQWKKINYVTLTFVDRGSEVDWITLEEGTKPGDEMPDNPTRSGYTFKGWYTERTGGRKITKTTAIQGDTTVYAQWKARTGTIANTGDGFRLHLWIGVMSVSAIGLAGVGVYWIRKKRK